MDLTSSRILVADDGGTVPATLLRELERAGCIVDSQTTHAAFPGSTREAPEALLFGCRTEDAARALRGLREAYPRVPVLVLAARGAEADPCLGSDDDGFDTLREPFDPQQVLRVVRRAVDTHRLREATRRDRQLERAEWGFDRLVAQSAAAQQLVQILRRAAQASGALLLSGEFGLDKLQLARAVHCESPARDETFRALTCSSQARFEAELFGDDRASAPEGRKRGWLELAARGTLFLDEIADTSAEVQDKLARFLQSGTFRRVGGTTDIKVSVRVIAATSRDLERDQAEGRLRRELVQRFGQARFNVPPLRERRDDVVPMARQLVRQYAGELHRGNVELDPEAEARLRDHVWPGNERELRNVIERAVVLARSGRIGANDLGLALQVARADGAAPSVFTLPPEGLVFEELEKELLRQALQRVRGNRTRAARLLGLNRDRIRYRIQKFRLEELAPEAT